MSKKNTTINKRKNQGKYHHLNKDVDFYLKFRFNKITELSLIIV